MTRDDIIAQLRQVLGPSTGELVLDIVISLVEYGLGRLEGRRRAIASNELPASYRVVDGIVDGELVIDKPPDKPNVTIENHSQRDAAPATASRVPPLGGSGSESSPDLFGSLLSKSDLGKVNMMSRRRGVVNYSSAFLDFWMAYPRKAGKGDAWKAWRDLAKGETPDVSRMLATLTWQRQSREWMEDGGQYIPYPGGWLRARRWEDEPPTRSNGAPPPPLTKPRLPEFRECLPENLPQLPEWAK